MITRFEKICPVCGEKFFWTNPKEDPEVCYKRMCRQITVISKGILLEKATCPLLKI